VCVCVLRSHRVKLARPSAHLTHCPSAVQVFAFENASANTVLAPFSVSDVDPGQTVGCGAVVTDCFPTSAPCPLGLGLFGVTQPTGGNDGTGRALSLVGVLNFELVSSYTVVIQCNDSGVPTRTVSRSLLLTVVDSNDPPSDVRLVPSGGAAIASVPENAPVGFVIGTVVVTDPDAGQTHTVALG
jgi:hypothetical protein